MAHGHDLEDRVKKIITQVGLRIEHLRRFPHSFSGGQRQRIGIARALVVNPSLVIADEPVSALDVSIQAQILNLLKDLQSEFGLTYVFVSHNMSVIRYISDRIAVMYAGKLVELGSKEEVLAIHAIRIPNCYWLRCHVLWIANKGSAWSRRVSRRIWAIYPKVVSFQGRCKYVKEICKQEEPQMRPVGEWSFCQLSYCRRSCAARHCASAMAA